MLQEEAPGWLYAVKKGATSIWETWKGIDAQGQPHESLNHYSYGAVCGWHYEGDAIIYEFRIPANVTAQVILPDGRQETVACGSYTFGMGGEINAGI